uniref:F-box domain-containing protein n=1 Tax=Hordeum vulgare subsp. vulgare TaxID=112509 RepID=A0A8I7BAD6_HORVV
MREVFTRLPADDRRSLVRAAAVCRSWCGILTDPGFARGYRAFHGAAPMLGFLHNAYRSGNCFVPTSTFRWRASQDRDYLVLDSWHGLVLLYAPAYEVPFDACDLVANKWWEICRTQVPRHHALAGRRPPGHLRWPTALQCANATVLCAKDRCDHLDCHGGHFFVALVGSADEVSDCHTLATVYSSETGEWSDIISIQAPGFEIDTGGRTAVVGNNKVYVQNYEGDSVVEYNIREQQLSVIMAPDIRGKGYLDLLGVEDGMLLFGSVLSHRLYLCLWSMEAGPRGAAAWARHRVVDLEPLPPHRALMDM